MEYKYEYRGNIKLRILRTTFGYGSWTSRFVLVHQNQNATQEGAKSLWIQSTGTAGKVDSKFKEIQNRNENI